MKYVFRDRDADGEMHTFLECMNPVFIIDPDMIVRIKYGERDDLKETLARYSILGAVLIEAPKDQEELDRLFQSTGYFRKYYSALTNSLNKWKEN